MSGILHTSELHTLAFVLFSTLQCSSTCGAGEQTRQVQCVARNGDNGPITGVLSDNNCEGAVRPVDRQSCDDGPCDRPEWMTSDWSGVSLVCFMHISNVVFP
jgi:hypothetical protein